jgi:hypothetical protein
MALDEWIAPRGGRGGRSPGAAHGGPPEKDEVADAFAWTAPCARIVKQLAALGCLLAACVHGLRPEEPPRDARKRWEAEMDACFRRALPAWLGDPALAEAARLDRLEAQASRSSDSFKGGVYTSQPPPSIGGGRVPALLEERVVFEERCRVLRSSGKGTGRRP